MLIRYVLNNKHIHIVEGGLDNPLKTLGRAFEIIDSEPDLTELTVYNRVTKPALFLDDLKTYLRFHQMLYEEIQVYLYWIDEDDWTHSISFQEGLTSYVLQKAFEVAGSEPKVTKMEVQVKVGNYGEFCVLTLRDIQLYAEWLNKGAEDAIH